MFVYIICCVVIAIFFITDVPDKFIYNMFIFSFLYVLCDINSMLQKLIKPSKIKEDKNLKQVPTWIELCKKLNDQQDQIELISANIKRLEEKVVRYSKRRM